MYKLFFVLLLICPLSSAYAADEKTCLSMYVVINNVSGYLNAEGKISGYHVDVIDELASRSGICIDKSLVPYSRALKGLKYGEYDAGIVVRQEKMDPKLIYLTKILTSKTVLVPRNGITFSHYQQLSELIIGKLRGVDLDNTLAKSFNLLLIDLHSYEQGIRLLQKGRIDAIAGNSLMLGIVNKLGLVDTVDFKAQLVLGKKEIWLAFSNKSSHIEQLNTVKQAAQAMVEDGSLELILEEYFGSDWKSITQ